MNVMTDRLFMSHRPMCCAINQRLLLAQARLLIAYEPGSLQALHNCAFVIHLSIRVCEISTLHGDMLTVSIAIVNTLHVAVVT